MRNTEEFVLQFTRNERQIRYYIASLVANKSDVDDIMREASSLLWNKYDLYDPERPFLPWAMRFAYNAVRTYRQKLGTRRKYFTDELYVFNKAALPSHASSLHMENTPNQIVDVSFVPWLPSTLAVAD